MNTINEISENYVKLSLKIASQLSQYDFLTECKDRRQKNG
jgi:hypothetical protein